MDVNLTKMIDYAILSLINNLKDIKCCFIFILKEDNGENTNLRQHLHNICNEYGYTCKILSVNYLTEGPASTAYLAKELIANDIPLIISNSDQVLDWNFMNFWDKSINYDGCVLTYQPPYEIKLGETDKHSFVKFDDNGKPYYLDAIVWRDLSCGNNTFTGSVFNTKRERISSSQTIKIPLSYRRVYSSMEF
jgi:hypothetical protein